MTEGQQDTCCQLGINSVRIGGPVRLGVFVRVSEPTEFKCSCHDSHHVSCTPQDSNGGEEECNTKEVIVDVIQFVVVLFTLQFNDAYGD